MELNSRLFFLLGANMSAAWGRTAPPRLEQPVTAPSKREFDLEDTHCIIGELFSTYHGSFLWTESGFLSNSCQKHARSRLLNS